MRQTMENLLPESEKMVKLMASISANPIATIITDNRKADNPIIAANDAFLQLTGYSTDEVIGRNCRFLAGSNSEPEARATIRTAVAEGRPAVVELWNYRKDGSAFRNALMVAPIRNDAGEAVFFVGTQMEVRDQSYQKFDPNQARRRALALSPKQRQLLSLITNGHRTSQIGERLGIGTSAVSKLRNRLLVKLGVSTTADAIRIGVQAGLTTRA